MPTMILRVVMPLPRVRQCAAAIVRARKASLLGQELVGEVDADIVGGLAESPVLEHQGLRSGPLLLARIADAVRLGVRRIEQARRGLELLDLDFALDARRD